MERSSKPVSIDNLVYRSKNFILPKYQTGERWDANKSRELIESVLEDFPIPTIFVSGINDVGKQQVLDGQQRLKAIVDFRVGDTYLIRGVNGEKRLYYKNLTPEQKGKFNSYDINLETVTGTDKELSKVFRRLNSGVYLNEAEKRNAIDSSLNDFFITTVKSHPLFKKLNIKNDKRQAHKDLLARLVLLTDKGLVALSNGALIKQLDTYKTGVPKKLEKKVIGLLDTLDTVTGNNTVKKQNLITLTSVIVQMDNLKKPINTETFLNKLLTVEKSLVATDPSYALIARQGGYGKTILTKRAIALSSKM